MMRGLGGACAKSLTKPFRYPGVMCDVESYVYLPMLEEMDYMPKRKYSSGEEIRLYAESIARKYSLHERTMFQCCGKDMNWDDKAGTWNITITEKPKGGQESSFNVHAEFVILGTGLLNNVKLPRLEGMDTFGGHMFHTARWDYDYTGGTSAEPKMTGLEGKTIAFIGTGATAVQSLPELARYAKDVYIFQRTPSSVDSRGNHDTDANIFRSEIANKAGWHRERSENFNAFVTNAQPLPAKDMVNDQWTKLPTFYALIGSPEKVTMENVCIMVELPHSSQTFC